MTLFNFLWSASMAEGTFSIFPDSNGGLGSAFRDGLLSSQKKALRDVKNTLQLPLLSGNAASKHNSQSSIEVPGKHHVKHLPTKSQSFNVFEDSDEQFWPPCNCSKTDDGYISFRLPNECLMNTDITYLARGLLGLKSDYEDEDDSGCSDLDEPFVPNNDFDYMDVLFSPYEMNIPLVDCHQPSLIELE